MRVIYFFRKPASSFFSIEQLFATVINALQTFSPDIVYLPVKKANPTGILRNCFFARAKQGQINHITGEVYYIALALKGSRTILTIHDLESLYSPDRYKNYLLQLLWLKLPVQKVKYVTVISEHSKQKLLSTIRVSPDKVVVIPNCVSFSKHDFQPKREITKPEPVLLQIGTKPNKNLERLIEAISGLRCKLLIIGKLTENQQSQLKRHDITFENHVQLEYEDVIKLYYKADIVTFVSTYEGFGLPILEANALGRPVITSNVTAMPEVAGEGALLVDPFNIAEIRHAVEKLINNDAYRNELIMAGFKNVQRFKSEKVAAQYEAVYRKVMAEAK